MGTAPFRRWRAVLAALLLPAMAAAAYLPAIRAGYIWDDDFYVTKNQTLRDLPGLWRIWTEPGATTQYYPLVHTTFWIEYRLWGLAPMGFHLVNVLLHGLGAVLVWRIARGLGLGGAWWVAAVFALHPVHVESVAWVTERKNVLSGVFYLGAMLAYLRFHPPLAELPGPSGRRGWYAAALALFACALLSKTVTCSLPAAILLLWWWKRPAAARRALRWVAPMLVLGAALAAVTVLVERHIIGAKGPDFALSIAQRCLIAGRAVWFYLGKLLLPVRLTFIYPRWEVDAGQWWQWLYPAAAVAALAALAALAWWRRWRGPLAAALLFVGTLTPALGFINVYPMRFSFVADHFQYLASLAMIGLLVGLAVAGLRRLGARGLQGGAAGGAALLAALGVLTWRQARVYDGEETLWRDTLDKNPGALMAYANLGTYLLNQGKAWEAAEVFRAGLRLGPDASLWNDMGAALELRGQPEAEGFFVEAVRLRGDDADYRYNLGRYLVDRGRAADALEHLRRAVELNPRHAAAWDRLGVAACMLDNTDEGIGHFRKAIEVAPDFAPAHINLATALLGLGRAEEAIRHAELAVRRGPDRVRGHTLLQEAMASLGRQGELLGLYRRLVAEYPAEPPLHHQLAKLLSQSGRTGEAIAQLRHANRLRADWPVAMSDLAFLLAAADDPQLRNGAEAVRLAERACALTGRRQAFALDALAAAYAETGRFDRAIPTAREAIAAAEAAGQAQMAAHIQLRLRLYEGHRPFRLTGSALAPR